MKSKSTKITNKVLAEALIKAKNYIKRHGWSQATYGYKAEGPVCLIGACNAVTSPTYSRGDYLEDDTAVTRKLREVFKNKLSITDIEEWNDWGVESRKEVFEQIDKAVAELIK